MNKKDMQNVSQTGNIHMEMREIEKLQKNPDCILTMATNTCTGFMTWFCC